MQAEQQSELLPCPFCLTSNVRVYPRTCDKKSPYDARDRAFPVARCACGASMDGKDWGDEQTAIDAWNRRAALSHTNTPQGWQPIESAPYETNVLAWLYLPKNPIASAPVIASRVFVEKDEPEHYGEYRRMVGCWWANGMYYTAGHVIAWQPLPIPPEQGGKG